MDMVQSLHRELQGLLKELPAFTTSGFSIFDLSDMEQQVENSVTFPAAGVMYEGAATDTNTNAATPAANRAGGAVLIDVQFSIIIALQYGYAGQGEDAKWPAFALLDDTRKKVLGFKGVNSRPWRYVGEKPEIQASENGMVYYSQIWRTYVPVVGNFNNV